MPQLHTSGKLHRMVYDESMNHQTLYVCTGGCKGVSPVAKNCGAANCARFNQPLSARVQCDACALAAEKDSGLHACPKCQEAS